VFTAILSPRDPSLKRGAVPKARPLERRGDILVDLIPSYKIPRGVGLASVLEMVCTMLQHKDNDVRSVGVVLTTEVYELFGNQVLPYLENLNDFLKASVNQSILESTGVANVLERQGPSVKAQNRPSVTMPRNNRTSSRKKNNTKARKKKGGKKQQRTQDAKKMRYEEEMLPGTHPQDELPGDFAPESYNDFEPTDRCNFCGHQDPKFEEDEKNLDLHFWQQCPMLAECRLCEQVIDIPSLWDHLLTECESAGNQTACPNCHAPFEEAEIEDHLATVPPCTKALPPDQANRCPLCSNDIPPGEDGWNEHLLIPPGCPENKRKLSSLV